MKNNSPIQNKVRKKKKGIEAQKNTTEKNIHFCVNRHNILQVEDRDQNPPLHGSKRHTCKAKETKFQRKRMEEIKSKC